MQQASDCDMVVAHDDDLATIDGLGHDSVGDLLNTDHFVPSCWQSLETLEPDVMMDLLRKSNIEIDKVSCGELLTLIESRLILIGAFMHKDLSLADNCPNTNASAVKVAMVSMKLQNRSR